MITHKRMVIQAVSIVPLFLGVRKGFLTFRTNFFIDYNTLNCPALAAPVPDPIVLIMTQS